MWPARTSSFLFVRLLRRQPTADEPCIDSNSHEYSGRTNTVGACCFACPPRCTRCLQREHVLLLLSRLRTTVGLRHCRASHRTSGQIYEVGYVEGVFTVIFNSHWAVQCFEILKRFGIH